MSILKSVRRITAVGVMSGAMVLAGASAASAHVSVSPSEAKAGGYAKIDVRVPHGCEAAATTTLRVKVPEGIYTVTPQIVAGWDVNVTKEPLSPPVDDGHGGQITEKATEIVWTGGPLPDERLQEFGISLKLPKGEAGDKIYFPSVQECEGGASEAWIEIPADGQTSDDLEKPSPVLTLAAASDDHAGDAAVVDTASDDGTDALTITALVFGVLGLLVGLLGVGLAMSKKKS